PLLAQDPLHPADRVALAVEEVADAAQEIDVVRPVVAAAAAALHRAGLGKPALPEAQPLLRHVEIGSDPADGAGGIRRLVHDRPRLRRASAPARYVASLSGL